MYSTLVVGCICGSCAVLYSSVVICHSPSLRKCTVSMSVPLLTSLLLHTSRTQHRHSRDSSTMHNEHTDVLRARARR